MLWLQLPRVMGRLFLGVFRSSLRYEQCMLFESNSVCSRSQTVYALGVKQCMLSENSYALGVKQCVLSKNSVCSRSQTVCALREQLCSRSQTSSTAFPSIPPEHTFTDSTEASKLSNRQVRTLWLEIFLSKCNGKLLHNHHQAHDPETFGM